MSTSTNINYSIGILREEGDSWERRTPLTPKDCQLLINEGVKIFLQPSEIRCFSDYEYTEIGGIIQEDLNECNLIIGIRAIPPSRMYKDKSYIFFAKANKANISNNILDEILKKNIRLFDYEAIKSKIEYGDYYHKSLQTRVISFGRFAGMAAVANIFKGMAELLLSRKFSTPFIFSKLSFMYSDIDHLLQSFVTIGESIKEQFLPEEICPFVVSILGNGHAAGGALEVLKKLPHEIIKPVDLFTIKERKDVRDKIFICVFEYKNIYVNANDFPIGSEINFHHKKIDYERFDKNDFLEHPDYYLSVFKYYLPYIGCVINALYWQDTFRKIIRKDHLMDNCLFKDSKLIGIADIACDINGSNEVLDRYTTFQKPFFIYEPITKEIIYDIDQSSKEGVIYHAIPTLAASLADDASIYFSSLFYKYALSIVKNQYPDNKKRRSVFIDYPELNEAVVLENGELSSKFKAKFSTTTILPYNNEDHNLTHKYKIQIKLKGHIFDSGMFKFIIDDCKHYSVSTRPVFIKIGHVDEDISIAYIDLFSNDKDKLLIFLNSIKEKGRKDGHFIDDIKSNIQ